MPIAAGRKKHRVTVFAPAGTSDDHPNVDAEIATGVAASIDPMPLQFQQAERLAAGGLRGQTSYTVGIGYMDLRIDWQLREECCSRRVFNIQSKIHDDKMIDWELTCVTS